MNRPVVHPSAQEVPEARSSLKAYMPDDEYIGVGSGFETGVGSSDAHREKVLQAFSLLEVLGVARRCQFCTKSLLFSQCEAGAFWVENQGIVPAQSAGKGLDVFQHFLPILSTAIHEHIRDSVAADVEGGHIEQLFFQQVAQLDCPWLAKRGCGEKCVQECDVSHEDQCGAFSKVFGARHLEFQLQQEKASAEKPCSPHVLKDVMGPEVAGAVGNDVEDSKQKEQEATEDSEELHDEIHHQTESESRHNGGARPKNVRHQCDGQPERKQQEKENSRECHQGYGDDSSCKSGEKGFHVIHLRGSGSQSCTHRNWGQV